MSDNIVSKQEFMNALKQDFTTTLRKVYINSLKREVAFREITVQEQKTISRIMIDNEDRKDIVYDAQCALINKCSLDQSFNIYQLTDFDKIKLLMFLYQTNMFKNEVSFTCNECGTDNKYKIDFTEVLKNLDKFDLDDKTYDFDNGTWKFKFTLNYPSVETVSEYYKSYADKYREASKKEIDALNNQLNIDYTQLFIKKVDIIKKVDNTIKTVDAKNFTTKELLEIFSMFPQDVLYTDDGIMTFIFNEFVKKIDDAYGKHKCGQCGAEYKNTIDGGLEGFF